MSYTPTNWQTGDTITAEKLNKLEGGVASGVMIVNASYVSGTYLLDRTFTEIYQAINNGISVYISKPDSSTPTDYVNDSRLLPVVMAYKYDTEYRIYVLFACRQTNVDVDFIAGPALASFGTDSATGYPTFLRRTWINIEQSTHTVAGYIDDLFSFG